MSELGGDQISIGMKMRKALDMFRYGSEIKHYHNIPISKDRARKLGEKLGKKGLKPKEVRLLSEYERAKLYTRNDNEEGRVLVLASGYDGIPTHVFGKERTTMSSLEAGKYFSPYLAFLGRTAGAKKIEADMFKTPMASKSFQILIINNMDVFNQIFMDKISHDKKGETIDPTIQLFNEARRLTKEGGKFIVTFFGKNTFKDLDEKTKSKIEQNGWKLENKGSSSTLSHYVFKAVGIKKRQ